MSKILKIGLLFLVMMIVLEFSIMLTRIINPTIMLYFGQFILILIPVLIIALILKVDFRERFKLKKFKLSSLLYCFILFLALLPISGFLSSLTSFIFGQNANGIDSYIESLHVSGLMQWFIIAITPAICEEMMFRGLLIDKKMGLNIHLISILSGLMFAMFHVGFDQLFYTFPLGMVFAYVTIISGSIFPAMFMHLLNNSLSTLFTLIPSGTEEIVTEEIITLGSLLPMFVAAAIGSLIIKFVLGKMIKSYNYNDKKRIEENKLDVIIYKKEFKLLTYMPQIIMLIYVILVNTLL